MKQPDAARWERVEALLDEALELPSEERATFLDQACGDDAGLRQEVESLLAEIEDPEAGSFLEQPALAAFAEPHEDAHSDPYGLIGKTVAHYRVVEHLGSGGMGLVYKAEDTRLKRTVALKFLPPELMRDLEARQRFLREAQAVAALDHANICTVYEIGEAEGRPFIVMAYVAGQTLKEKLKAGPLPLEEALDVAIQMAEGLQVAHERGIVHRDIKPSNVMVIPASLPPSRENRGTGSKGQVKVMDFGLAKVGSRTQLTRTGSTLGTVAYMSPEQTRGEAVDHRTDIWSLGIVLYQMITGTLPFRGDYEQAVVYSILNEAPVPLSELRIEVPGSLEHVVQKAMEKDPEVRYQHISELLDDLQRERDELRAPSQVGSREKGHDQPAPTKKRTLRLALFSITALIVVLGSVFLFRAATGPSREQGDTVATDELLLEVWTDRGRENVTYTEGELMTVYVRVNRPVYIQFINQFADGTRTLLLDNHYIDESKVNSPYQIPGVDFEIAAPFGNEILQVIAQTEPFDLARTEEVDGYRILEEDLDTYLATARGIKRVNRDVLQADKRVEITTRPRNY